jgi:hypothetical protein
VKHAGAESNPMDERQRAVAFLREHMKKHFAGSVALVDLPGYYALVHAGWRLQSAHPRYPPEGCLWRRACWGF